MPLDSSTQTTTIKLYKKSVFELIFFDLFSYSSFIVYTIVYINSLSHPVRRLISSRGRSPKKASGFVIVFLFSIHFFSRHS